MYPATALLHGGVDMAYVGFQIDDAGNGVSGSLAKSLRVDGSME